jgi:hypothetical protein
LRFATQGQADERLPQVDRDQIAPPFALLCRAFDRGEQGSRLLWAVLRQQQARVDKARYAPYANRRL